MCQLKCDQSLRCFPGNLAENSNNCHLLNVNYNFVFGRTFGGFSDQEVTDKEHAELLKSLSDEVAAG